MTSKCNYLGGIFVVAFAITALHQTLAEETPSIAARSQKALFVVSVGTNNCTGFLIARDPPLIATVAHIPSVAEKAEQILVRTNETGAIQKVRVRHLHKDFVKGSGKGSMPFSADLTLLELEGKSADFGIPLTLTKEGGNEDLRGKNIVSLGFPFYALAGEELQSPETIVRRGLIRRFLDYNGSTTSPMQKRPLLEHDLDALGGESGAPLILSPTGNVIGIQIGNRTFTSKETKQITAKFSLAIHVNHLWELLEQADMKKAILKASK